MEVKSRVLIVLLLLPLTLSWVLVPGAIPPGMSVITPAASGGPVPQAVPLPQTSEATPPPGADEAHRLYLPLVLKRACLVKIITYPGPSNVDYGPGVELPPGTEFTPVGRYGDFVKVQWRDEGGVLQEGFVWVVLVGNLPDDLPMLSKDEVPWIKYRVFNPEQPIELANDTDDDFKVIKIFGSAIKVNEDVQIEISAEVSTQSPEKTTGIGYENGLWGSPDFRRLGIYYQNGQWFLIYSVGDQYPIYTPIPGVSGTAIGRLNLHIDKANQQVRVTRVVDPDGVVIQEQELLRVTLPQDLYAPSDIMGFSEQVARDSRLHTNSLSIYQAPTGEYRENSQDSLGKLAKRLGVTFGAATNPWNDPFDVGETKILAQEAKVLLPVGDFYWENIHPEPNRYDFTLADITLNFAYMNGMDIFIQPLFYHLAFPAWLEQGNYSADQLREIMRDHVFQIINRYKARYPDRTIYITVVNELDFGQSENDRS